MTLANNGTGMDHFLTPTEYLDAGHPLVRTTAATLIRDAVSDTERVRRIYYYVRDVPTTSSRPFATSRRDITAPAT